MAFLANLNTREFHDLSVGNANCQIGEIGRSKQYDTMAAALNAGFDPCDYCLPQVLAARIKQNPSPVGRATTLTLDGAKSKPRRGPMRVTDWRWEVTPSDGVGKKITSEEQQISFVLLGEVTVSLRVKNAQGQENSRTRTISPVKRRWKKIDWSTPARNGALNALIVDGFLSLGRNICGKEAESAEQTSGHGIHRDDLDHATWRAHYTRKRVEDGATEPWGGCWYVDGHTLFIARDELRSSDLFADTELWKTNTAAGHSKDIRNLRDSVIDHEHHHSMIMYGSWQKDGMKPVRALEALVRTSEDTLIHDADQEIIALETQLQDPAGEGEVHSRMAGKWAGVSATVLIHDGADGYISRTFPDLAQIGD